jgi:hypothetical protein
MPYRLSVTVDHDANLIIGGAERVFRVLPGGTLALLAGTGGCCYSGDDGQATSATIWTINGLAADSAGNIYVADGISNAVRVLRPAVAT